VVEKAVVFFKKTILYFWIIENEIEILQKNPWKI